MESNTLSDPNSKLNRYVTECLIGLFKYATVKTIGVRYFIKYYLFNFY